MNLERQNSIKALFYLIMSGVMVLSNLFVAMMASAFFLQRFIPSLDPKGTLHTMIFVSLTLIIFENQMFTKWFWRRWRKLSGTASFRELVDEQMREIRKERRGQLRRMKTEGITPEEERAVREDIDNRLKSMDFDDRFTDEYPWEKDDSEFSPEDMKELKKEMDRTPETTSLVEEEQRWYFRPVNAVNEHSMYYAIVAWNEEDHFWYVVRRFDREAVRDYFMKNQEVLQWWVEEKAPPRSIAFSIPPSERGRQKQFLLGEPTDKDMYVTNWRRY